MDGATFLMAVIIVLLAGAFAKAAAKVPQILHFARGVSLIFGLLTLLRNWDQTVQMMNRFGSRLTPRLIRFINWFIDAAFTGADRLLDGLEKIFR